MGRDPVHIFVHLMLFKQKVNEWMYTEFGSLYYKSKCSWVIDLPSILGKWSMIIIYYSRVLSQYDVRVVFWDCSTLYKDSALVCDSAPPPGPPVTILGWWTPSRVKSFQLWIYNFPRYKFTPVWSHNWAFWPKPRSTIYVGTNTTNMKLNLYFPMHQSIIRIPQLTAACSQHSILFCLN